MTPDAGTRTPSAGARRPRVSVVIAFYHGADFLPGALDACVNQNERDVEVIVVDSGFDSAGSALLASAPDERMRVLDAPAGSGLAELWNLGLAAARGDALMCLTDCDRLRPFAIQRLLASLATGGGAECAYAGQRVVNLESGEAFELQSPPDYNEACLRPISPIYLFTQKAYAAVGGYDPRCFPALVLDHWFRLFERFEPFCLQDIACETVIYPWRTKNPDFTDINMMETAVRWRHGRATLEHLGPWLRRYIAGVWRTPNDWRLLSRWYLPTGGRLAKLSPQLGVYWAGATALTLGRRFVQSRRGYMDDVETAARAVAEAARTERVRTKAPQPGTQVLVLIPRVVMGGSEKVVNDVVEGLKPRGFRFHLLAERGHNNAWCEAFRDVFDNVVETSIPGNHVPEAMPEYVALLRRLISDWKIELILISNAYPGYQALSAIRDSSPDLPVVDILHVEQYSGMSSEFLSRASFVDRRVCISPHLKRILLGKYDEAGYPPELRERVEVVYNGLDFAGFERRGEAAAEFRAAQKLPADAVVVTAVGRMEQEKRPQLFVDVALRLIEQHPDVPLYFVMAGDGVQRARVERRIDAKEAGDRFRLLGVIPHERVRDVLMASDLMVIASSIEGLPLVMVEALAMEVPVVATRVGGIGDVLESGRNGFVVEPNSELRSEFVRHLSRLVADPVLRKELSGRTRGTVVNTFAMSVMHDHYERILRSALAQRRRSAAEARSSDAA